MVARPSRQGYSRGPGSDLAVPAAVADPSAARSDCGQLADLGDADAVARGVAEARVDPVGTLLGWFGELDAATLQLSLCAWSARDETQPGSELGEVTVGPTTIGELEPGITYHYRLVVSNGSGTTDGEDETFTTLVAVLHCITKPAEEL